LDKNQKEIIKAYMETAKDKIESAEILFKYRKYDDTVSRAYYAVFSLRTGIAHKYWY
jgi:uncharacterized protein (UPF0332 family)